MNLNKLLEFDKKLLYGPAFNGVDKNKRDIRLKVEEKIL